MSKCPALYTLADVVVNFPDYDGLPVSLFEAAACKRTIITNNLPAYREILGSAAFYGSTPKDVVGLAEAMRSVLAKSPEALATELETNYALVAEKADQLQCMDGMIRTYESLIMPGQNKKI